MLADPRRKVNGESDMRPYQIGTSDGTRVRLAAARMFKGSGRSFGGVQRACAERGIRCRAALPSANRWRRVRAAGGVRSGEMAIWFLYGDDDVDPFSGGEVDADGPVFVPKVGGVPKAIMRRFHALISAIAIERSTISRSEN
jgi:hypothetical protein